MTMIEKPTRPDMSGWCRFGGHHHLCRFTYEGLKAYLECPCTCHGQVVEDKVPILRPKVLKKVKPKKMKEVLAGGGTGA